MKKNNIGLDIFLIVLLYFVIQTFCSFAIVGIDLAINFDQLKEFMQGEGNKNDIMAFARQQLDSLLGIILVVASVLTILVIALLKKVNLRHEFSFNDCKWKYAPYVFLAFLIGTFACNILEENLNLPNLIQDQLVDMSHDILGILAVAVIGPVAEEVIFRGAICGGMLRAGCKPWTAILVSAVIFGLVHMNPAQIPFAAALGVMFAIIYYKTNSIIPSAILHIINNSFACYMMIEYADQPDITFTEMLGQITAIIIMIAGLAISVLMYIKYWKTR